VLSLVVSRLQSLRAADWALRALRPRREIIRSQTHKSSCQTCLNMRCVGFGGISVRACHSPTQTLLKVIGPPSISFLRIFSAASTLLWLMRRTRGGSSRPVLTSPVCLRGHLPLAPRRSCPLMRAREQRPSSTTSPAAALRTPRAVAGTIQETRSKPCPGIQAQEQLAHLGHHPRMAMFLRTCQQVARRSSMCRLLREACHTQRLGLL